MMKNEYAIRHSALAIGWGKGQKLWFVGEGLVYSDAGGHTHFWNPLRKKDQAMDLLVILMMDLHLQNMELGYRLQNVYYTVPIGIFDGDVHASVRRAIVQAASNIGELK